MRSCQHKGGSSGRKTRKRNTISTRKKSLKKSKTKSKKERKSKKKKKRETKLDKLLAQHKIMVISIFAVRRNNKIDRNKLNTHLDIAKEKGLNYLILDDAYDTGFKLYDVKTKKKISNDSIINIYYDIEYNKKK